VAFIDTDGMCERAKVPEGVCLMGVNRGGSTWPWILGKDPELAFKLL